MVDVLTSARAVAASLRRKAEEVRAKAWANFEATVYEAKSDISTPQV